MNRTIKPVAFVRAFAVTAVWLLSAVAPGQQLSPTGQLRTLDVQSPRPLADAIRELERRHGWMVTYEEVPYEYSGELLDVTGSVRKDGDLTKPVLVPKGGHLSFTYVDPLPNGESEEAVLMELLRQYRASGLPGEFRLARTGDVFHVIPWTTRNALGVDVERQSPLDALISIPEGERTVQEMLSAVTSAMYAEGALPTALGGVNGPVASNLFLQNSVAAGADRERARSVLLRTLQATRRRLSWNLYCGPAGTGRPVCALNFHTVDQRSTTR